MHGVLTLLDNKESLVSATICTHNCMFLTCATMPSTIEIDPMLPYKLAIIFKDENCSSTTIYPNYMIWFDCTLSFVS